MTSLKETIDQYARYLFNDKGYTAATVQKYCGNIRKLFRTVGIREIAQVNSRYINSGLTDMFWSRLESEGKALSDTTRINYLSALKAFIVFAHSRKLINEDFSSAIDMPRRRVLHLEGMSESEQKRFRNYIADPDNLKTEKNLRDAALAMFLWATGARISEAIALNCHPDSYIYFHDPAVRSGDFHVDGNKIYVHISGKGKRDRVIRVSDDAVIYLNLYLHQRKHKNNILFQNIHNNVGSSKRLTRSGAAWTIKRLLDDAGIKKESGLNTHIFRHTAINYWMDMGLSDSRIMAMTGHSSPEGLFLYRMRNKRQTDIFGDKAKTTAFHLSERSKELERLLRARHYKK